MYMLFVSQQISAPPSSFWTSTDVAFNFALSSRMRAAVDFIAGSMVVAGSMIVADGILRPPHGSLPRAHGSDDTDVSRSRISGK